MFRFLFKSGIVVFISISTFIFGFLFFSQAQGTEIPNIEIIQDKECPIYTNAQNYLDITDKDKLEVIKLIILKADKIGIDPNFAISLAYIESKFDRNAKSHVGAYGVMQLMPIHGSQRTNLEDNIEIGLKFIKERLEYYNYDYKKALMYYNGGWKSQSDDPKYSKIRRKTINYYTKIMKLNTKLNNNHYLVAYSPSSH